MRKHVHRETHGIVKEYDDHGLLSVTVDTALLDKPRDEWPLALLVADSLKFTRHHFAGQTKLSRPVVLPEKPSA